MTVGPGLCTIQPTASLGTGQLQAPSAEMLERSRPGYTTPRFAIPRDTPPEVTPTLAAPAINTDAIAEAIRVIDFAVDCLMKVGDEYVRVLSIAVGADDIQSFRCVTTSVHDEGEDLEGVAALRVHLEGHVWRGGERQDASGRTDAEKGAGVCGPGR